VKRAVNAALRRLTGYELRRSRRRVVYRPPDSRGRLLTAPAFILSTVRSGSTLLRVLLDSHSQICSPHEIHLRDLALGEGSRYTEKSLREISLDRRQLEYVLWDWVLHRELEESGKRLLVNKAPSNVFIVDRIVECWPDARFVFLLRHPGAVARSRHAVRPQDSVERNVAKVLSYGQALEDARQEYPGATVRYEDLAADPAPVMQELCRFLGVPWEPGLLEYGQYAHGRYRSGLGDWKEKIRSGEVQPPEPPPPEDEVPPALRSLCAVWGYESAPSEVAAVESAAAQGSAGGSKTG
jgi:hypothetical protein